MDADSKPANAKALGRASVLRSIDEVEERVGPRRVEVKALRAPAH